MKDKMEMLKSYISVNVCPILIDFWIDFTGAIIIPANSKIEELNWYDLINDNKAKIIIIKDIDSIPKIEQLKFKELLKYKQINTLKIPENTRIILTAKNINKETINEEIYSLVAHI